MGRAKTLKQVAAEDNAWLNSSSNKSGIRTVAQAYDWINGKEGQAVPFSSFLSGSLKESTSISSLKYYVPGDIKKVALAASDPVAFVKQQFHQNMFWYVYWSVNGVGPPYSQANFDNTKKELQKSFPYFIENKVPATEIQSLVESGAAQYKNYVQSVSKQGFMDKIFGIAENLIVGGLSGGLGLSALQVAGLNTALAIASGAKVEDALKSGMAGLAANQVGQYLQTVKAVTDNPVVNTAITNSAQSAAAASVLGQDVKKAALAGLAGGAVAGSLYKATDKAAISRAAGEYTQAIAAGQSPQIAMMSALSSFVDTEMDEAKRKIQAEADAELETKKATKTADAEAKARLDQIVEAFEQPTTIPKTTDAYYPTAALESIGGQKLLPAQAGKGEVTDEPLFAGSKFNVGVDQKASPIQDVVVGGKTYQMRDITDASGNITTYYFDPTDKKVTAPPPLFEGSNLQSSPNASITDAFDIKDVSGKVFKAKDLTYDDGTVVRAIFDPETKSVKQQLLKEPPSADLEQLTKKIPAIEITPDKNAYFSVAAESEFLDELKKAALTGDLQKLIDVTEKAELPAAVEAKKFFESIKPESKEFSQSLLKLPTQDLRDLTSLLTAGAGQGSPFSAEKLTSLSSVFNAAEAKANDLMAKAKADPTPENISAAASAQTEALTAKYNLSQSLLPSEAGQGLKLTLPGTGVTDLADLEALSAARGQPLGQNLRYQMDQAKAAANEALVTLQSANTPETVQAARDALANYELSQKMYTQVAGEEFPLLPDEKLASQEFPLVDEAVKSGFMLGLSPAQPMTPRQRYERYQRLSGQKEDEEGLLGDTGLGIAVLPRFQGFMEPEMFARGGLAALRRF